MPIQVHDELTTIQALCNGASIARYGDGEIDLAYGMREEVFENHGTDLAQRMREILEDEQENLLVGVPNIFSAEAKARLSNPPFWERYEPHFCKYLREDREYYSSFISRPDNISRHPGDPPASNARRVSPEFWDQLEVIWQDRPVAIVNFEPDVAENPIYNNTASRTFIPCERRNAWGENGDRYRDLLSKCLETASKGNADLFLISAGPVACVLASDLCAQSIQAIDIGQAARIYLDSIGEDHRHLY